MSKLVCIWIWLPGVAIALPVSEGLKEDGSNGGGGVAVMVAIALPVSEGLKVFNDRAGNLEQGCNRPSGIGRVESCRFLSGLGASPQVAIALPVSEGLKDAR